MSTVAKLRAELAELRDHFDRKVADRTDLILRARSVAPNAIFDARMTDEQIRATAVAYANGHPAIDGRTPDYIEARFDHLAERQPVDPVVLALRTGSRAH